ncbi:MAG TPA: FG-GAP-like repeat-containing protein [Candidatus Didemnitutus sp.]
MKTKFSLLLAAVAALGFAQRADAFAYITNDSTGLPVKWAPGTITMKIVADNTTKLSDGTTRATAVAAAMQTWNALLGNEQFAWTITPTGTAGDGNHSNEVSFASTIYGQAFSTNVLAVTTDWASGNERAEADTVFNTKYGWDSYRDSEFNHNSSIDIERVATHELGHNLGLDHPDQATPPQFVSAIMNSVISNIIAPTADDIAGAQSLYGPAPLGSVPANDNFGGAITLVLSNNAATVTGFNTNATKQSGEPNHAGDPGGRSVWWRWTAPSNGGVSLDTNGSVFDTTLGVYTGNAVNALTTITSNDDVNPGIVQHSAVTFNATGGTTYYFAVDGFDDTTGPGADCGEIKLNLAFAPASGGGGTTTYGPSDFNHDGSADILWENTSTGDRSMWAMNHESISSFVSLGGIPTEWHIVGSGDFNGDGQTDIVWEDTATGDRSVWLMNGTSLGSFLYLANIPTVWHIAAVADFNSDGKPDLVWENSTTGDRTIWLMNGGAISSMVYLAGIPVEWKIVGAADFNNDGQTDIVWEDTVTGDRNIWLMNGTSLSSFAFGANVSTAWHIAAVADYDGDGKPDLLWENLTTGDRAFWIMNGTNEASTPYLAGIPGVWHIAP